MLYPRVVSVVVRRLPDFQSHPSLNLRVSHGNLINPVKKDLLYTDDDGEDTTKRRDYEGLQLKLQLKILKIILIGCCWVMDSS